MEDEIVILLHTGLEHLGEKNTYLRLLFIEYSSPFTTGPGSQHLTMQLECHWAPVLKRNVYKVYVYTHKHTLIPPNPPTQIIKSVNLVWCHSHDLAVNINTKEVIVDFGMSGQHTPLIINGKAVGKVASFKLFKLTVTKAQQRLFYLRVKWVTLLQRLLVLLYYCGTERASRESMCKKSPFCCCFQIVINIFFVSCVYTEVKTVQTVQTLFFSVKVGRKDDTILQ